ncbi:P-II family nitrogen regulator [Alteromonas sp. ASW11-36]|uniref:P-II family nitrogen regulator n=1 Tax=Alteromonas arenosi TaxID=3055817 RepID=A0ABT7SUD7_9ALTE|nr:P-II family nitrogen regulator [Alteromonas sp. ASW11-36]MDM7859813.1 P-II family nitrogen regulator [Alteromonas sp. ASW11-36]
MTLYTAEKLVIITEKLICEKVCSIITKAGATGYTLTPAGGKGSRNKRSTADRATVVDDFSNVKIEVIVSDKAMAEAIVEEVAHKYFNNYSGIAYVEDVGILRQFKFNHAELNNSQ